MSEGVVAEILAYNSLCSLEHWSFLVAWLKARQQVEDLSVGSGVGELDLYLAREDVVQLLPIFCGSLYSIPQEDFKLLVEPYLSLFSLEMQTCLEFHFHSAVKEALYRNRTLNAALKTAVTHPPVNLSKMKLLFRASTTEFVNLKFHEACDGKPNTLTVIKTVSG
ncbi:hypothetical protein HDU98_005808 [Podochytrium sp. JEL0797]|nr:hypothetical protein HDU98_005808 [Podochytrium sp. JEL0797]